MIIISKEIFRRISVLVLFVNIILECDLYDLYTSRWNVIFIIFLGILISKMFSFNFHQHCLIFLKETSGSSTPSEYSLKRDLHRIEFKWLLIENILKIFYVLKNLINIITKNSPATSQNTNFVFLDGTFILNCPVSGRYCFADTIEDKSTSAIANAPFQLRGFRRHFLPETPWSKPNSFHPYNSFFYFRNTFDFAQLGKHALAEPISTSKYKFWRKITTNFLNAFF